MLKRAVLLTLLALLVVAFPGAILAQDGGDGEEAPAPEPLTLEHDGLERTYYLTIPESYDGEAAYPLVLTLHGGGGSGLEMKTALGFDELAEFAGYIVAYPDGVENEWEYLDLAGESDEFVDDLGFLTSLIDTLQADYNISDVYVMGWSNGGLMALQMRCSLADRLDAVAVVGATMTFRLLQTCLEAPPVDLMQIIGTADQAFPWEGSMEVTPAGGISASLSIVQTVGFITGQGQCENTFANEAVNPMDSPVTVQLWGYDGCTDDTVYRLYGVVEQPHAWPSGLIFGSINTNRPVDAQQLVFEFFGADFNPESE